jgi:hypothetical protein
MPIRRNLLERIIKEEYEKLLNEFVVPVGFSLPKWKQHRKKHNITNAEYHKEHPETKWKVVHGHKEGHIGEPLKGMENMSYQKATKAHAAIAMNEFVEPTTTNQSFTTTSTVASTRGDVRKAQLAQAAAATRSDQSEISGVERTLILDLEEKFRELANIKGVNLIRLRPRIEQMLKIFYKTFNSQIEADKSQQKELSPTVTDPTQTKQKQGIGVSKPLTLE